MSSIWDFVKRGWMFLVWYGMEQDDYEDDYVADDFPRRGETAGGIKPQLCYMPPDEHNCWGTMPDFSLGMPSSDDDYGSAGAFDNSFGSSSGLE